MGTLFPRVGLELPRCGVVRGVGVGMGRYRSHDRGPLDSGDSDGFGTESTFGLDRVIFYGLWVSASRRSPFRTHLPWTMGDESKNAAWGRSWSFFISPVIGPEVDQSGGSVIII